jgi:hypothetical protein
MKKRILAGFLWFFAGWYLGAFLAFMVGVPEVVGPILGLTLAALVAGDPRHVIWKATPGPAAGTDDGDQVTEPTPGFAAEPAAGS